MDEPATVKVGEKEYKEEDLAKLVGLGEVAQEYETKWNRKIGEFYPDYTQKSQKLAEFEKQEIERAKVEEEAKKKDLVERAKAEKLTPEEERQLALQQAKDLGIVTQDQLDTEVNKRVANTLAAKQLIDDTRAVIEEAKEKGQPQSNVKDLLQYMEENGLKNPEKAYKLMFEPEIDKWKEEKIRGIRPSGFDTQTGSTAGAKQPPPPTPISREDLGKAIRESLTRSYGGQV